MAVLPPLEDEFRPRRRIYRRIRTAVTMLALTALVSWSAWYAWSVVTEPAAEPDAEDQEAVAAAPVCAVPEPTEGPEPEDVSINVYNATSENGLASSTARELREIGFVILDVANDPERRAVSEVAEIRAHSDDDPAVQLVMSYFPGSVFQGDEREEDTVDVVLGNTFHEVGQQPDEPDPESTVEPLPWC